MSDMERIIQKLKDNKSEAEDLLRTLVEIDTVVPPGNNYDKIAEIVGDYMRNIGCRVTIYNSPEKYLKESGWDRFDPPLMGPRPNVIGEYGMDGGETILFNGHLDIVPIGTGWTKNPFGELIDGNFYGRGSGDNKGGVVAMIMAVKGLIDADLIPKGKVILTATVDEEIGGIAGLRAVIEEGLVKADYGVSCDGDQESVSISNQGRFKGKVITEGIAVHSSRAQDGVNAIETMAKVVLAIQRHARDLRTRETRLPAPPSTGRKFIYPTANVGIINGGLKENIVPDFCSITFNRRITPEETLGTARKELLEIVENALSGDETAKWKYEEINTREPSFTEPNHPYVTKFRDVAQEVLKREIPVYGGLGGNDVCFMRNILNIPAVQFGAARNGSGAHGIDEHIRIDDLIDASKVYAAFIVELLGVA